MDKYMLDTSKVDSGFRELLHSMGFNDYPTVVNEKEFTEFAKSAFQVSWHDTPVNVKGWPFRYINWDEAAEDFKSRFTKITYQGNTYYCAP